MRTIKQLTLAGALLAGVLGCAATAAQPGSAGGDPEARASRPVVQERHPQVDFSIPCAECHADETPQVVEQWRTSAHGAQNVGCFVCHGDGEAEFAVRPRTETCYTCHAEKEEDAARLPAQSCFGCHGGHSLKFHRLQRGE